MQVFLITGFALDKRAFSLLGLPDESYQFIDLIPVNPGETLKDYALRLGEKMGIGPGDIIGGVSLGGMLALEIAQVVKVKGVILIASCTHPRQIRRRFMIFAPLAQYIPEFLIRRIFLMVPLILKWQKMLSPTGQALLADIMGHFPPSLLKSLPRMILNWPGQNAPDNFQHIHSKGDWLIRPSGNKDKLRLLPGKNHLITVSHPTEVREFIAASVELFLSRDLQN